MEVWEGSPSFSGQQNFDGKHQRGPYGPEHDKLEELPNLGPNLRSSPGAHLSGATTPNKGAVGSIGPPFLTKSPQGPDSAPAFKPVGLPGKDSLHVHDLSPLQRSRAAALQQQQQMFPNGGKPHQHQHQHQNLRASVGLEPGGGLTNPGPGPFGRGPSPLEGHLGRGPSPPNPPNGLSRDAMTPPPSLDEMAERMSRMKVSPSQLSPSQLRQLAQLAGVRRADALAEHAAGQSVEVLTAEDGLRGVAERLPRAKTGRAHARRVGPERGAATLGRAGLQILIQTPAGGLSGDRHFRHPRADRSLGFTPCFPKTEAPKFERNSLNLSKPN